MRALIRGAPAVAGTAESMPLPDGSADAVFAAEAFHWFDAPVALPEIARVLRPRGGFAVMWNVGQAQDEEQPWRLEVVELVKHVYYHPQGRRVPAAAGNDWREQTAWQRGPGWELFEPLQHRPFEHTQRMTADDYLGFVSSWSFVAILEEAERGELLTSVRAVLDRNGVEAFDQRWRTDLHVTRLRA
jgi:SAM-dependent methyltransferase